MSADREFCVVCGRTGRVLTDGLCADCAAQRTRLITPPGLGVVTMCPTCGARKTGSRWDREGASRLLTSEDLTPLLYIHPEVGVRAVRWEETQRSGLLYHFHGTARLRFRGSERDHEVELTVKVEHRTCPACSRKSGRYYTAVLQLRGPENARRGKATVLRARLERQWEELMTESRADWRQAISWREALPEGWDYYAVDTLAARSIARLAKQRLGATVKESATLVGRKDGADVYRVTFCVRLPSVP